MSKNEKVKGGSDIEIIKILGTSDVIGLKFKDWASSAGLVENRLVEQTNYTMPNSDTTVTANYTAFAFQPKFTKINISSGNIDYTLNGEFIESERRLVKSGETAEDEFSCNHDFSSIPYEICEGTEPNQVPAGKYKIAVKHESKWYYSDIFTVNYGDNTTDENETTNGDENSKENNTQPNEEEKEKEPEETETDNISNERGNNNAKLPQTGEENKFVNLLLITIVLGSFWLVSMLLIEREKKKMMKR